jgi:DnaK suppressor protein
MDKIKPGDYRKHFSNGQSRLMNSINRKRLAACETKVENTEDEGYLAIISHKRELLVTLQESDFAWLRSIREAVERIDKGSYGECVSCGEDINESRLDALPWVSFCIRCQEQTEMDRAKSLRPEASADPEPFEF